MKIKTNEITTTRAKTRCHGFRDGAEMADKHFGEEATCVCRYEWDGVYFFAKKSEAKGYPANHTYNELFRVESVTR